MFNIFIVHEQEFNMYEEILLSQLNYIEVEIKKEKLVNYLPKISLTIFLINIYN